MMGLQFKIHDALADQNFDNFAYRQSNDVGIRPVDTPDQKGTHALDGVCASFVKGLSRTYIPFDFVFREVFKRDIRSNRLDEFQIVTMAADTKTSEDLMGFPGQTTQHAAGSFF